MLLINEEELINEKIIINRCLPTIPIHIETRIFHFFLINQMKTNIRREIKEKKTSINLKIN